MVLKLHARLLDPISRAVRFALGEKRLMVNMREVPVLGADAALLALDPDGRTPVLVDNSWQDDAVITETWAIFEYVEELNPQPPLFPGGPIERAAARATSVQAIRAFRPLVEVIVREKATKRLGRTGSPDVAALRHAQEQARALIQIAAKAAAETGWLVSGRLSLADLLVAAHVSVLDLLDAVDWDAVPEGRAWYTVLKQRPSFRPLLADKVPGISPPAHYADLDF